MLLDWFTVVAQIFNFLVLVWLLKHFFWARLVKAIDDREKRVAGRLAEAAEKDRQADIKAEKIHADEIAEERKRAELMTQAQRDADETRLRRIREARESVRALEKKWLDDLDREKKAYLDDVRQRTAKQMLAVIRRALADLACADLQSATVRVFLEKLRSLDSATLHEITAGGDLKVVTGADLTEPERSAIRQALGFVPFELVRDPDFGWGIELRAGGRKIGWNVASYLESLERDLSEALGHPAETALQMVS